jgi:hypothetical protein
MNGPIPGTANAIPAMTAMPIKNQYFLIMYVTCPAVIKRPASWDGMPKLSRDCEHLFDRRVPAR